MTLKVKKINSLKTLTDALRNVKPVKRFDSNKHLGKVKWLEDPVEYQNRLRNEWH